ncbi:MAG: hypothetical protein NT003_00145 [Candidatus Magasanikbacteria bacterium]|nr:hypothetical protein [Candidatus Magasanikbacteria bacterium]
MIIAIALAFASKKIWGQDIGVKELVVLLILPALIMIGAFEYAKYDSLESVENWNGRITEKTHGTQGCCHCRQVCDTCRDSKGNSSSCNCKTVCDHIFDYYWGLNVSTGDNLSVRTCEPFESNEPELWTRAVIGEPASVPHTYTNYLKADPDSLLVRGAQARYLDMIPDFPHVYRLYHVNKVLALGVEVDRVWQAGLEEMNADLGAQKQVDVTVVVTKVNDPTFADAVETRWLYGPKNAIIIVLGVPEGQRQIQWARVVTISRVEELKIELRDGLMKLSIDEPEKALALIRQTVDAKFTRTHMSEFEYLASAATPSTGWLVFLYILDIAGSLALGYVFSQTDPFKENWGRRSYY